MNWIGHIQIRRVAAAVTAGAVVAYPTEAVWGLGCDPRNEQAVQRLLALKGRSASKGLILIAANNSQLLPYTKALSDNQWSLITENHSFPVTWTVPASQDVPWWLTGGRGTIAVRVTRHPVAAALCAVFGGALVSTSANPAGLPPAHSALKVRSYFGPEIEWIAPGRVGNSNRPSEIRDLLSGRIIRRGG